MQSLLTLEEAQAEILGRAVLLPAETVPVEQAAGSVLVEPALARVDLPPFASSAMDGFAVRSSETPATLPIAFSVAAGKPSSEELPVGSAATIATGGAVPEGADSIVPVEQTVQVPRSEEWTPRLGPAELLCWGVLRSGLLRHPVLAR